MTDDNSSPHIAALQELEAALDAHRRTQAAARAPAHANGRNRAPKTGRTRGDGRGHWGLRKPGWRLPFNPWFMFDRRHPVVRKTTIAIAAAGVVVLVSGGVLWWRLASGPIILDLATPYLTAAIEQNLGGRYRVAVGGTQLERDAQGHTAIRLRDIVLRDTSGATVAVAPKAEVRISGTSLLFASPRVESIRLVDANMTIRIDNDGQVNVLVGGDRPFATMAPAHESALQSAPAKDADTELAKNQTPVPAKASEFSLQVLAQRSLATNFTALLSWIDQLGTIGLDPSGANTGGFDGRSLTEIGIVNGSISINDRRDGYEWKVTQITLSLSRPKVGGVALTVVSDNQDRPWAISTALTPAAEGHRRLQLEARKVVLDDLLALRMSESRIRSDTQISASIDADVAADGTPQVITGSVVAQGGSIGDPAEPDRQIPIASAEFGLDWDINRRTLRVPFKVAAGAARFTLRAEFAAPAQTGGNWIFAVGGGWIVIDPLKPNEDGLVLKRVVMRGSINPVAQRVTLEHGDFGTKELGSGGDEGVTIAASGRLDYGNEPRIAVGIAGNPMPAAAFKRLWPSFIAPKVHDWVVEHIVGGTVGHMDIAANTTLASLQPGVDLPDEGLSIDIVGTGAVLRPVAGLPPIRDADLNVHVNGRAAKVALSKGAVEVSPGRRLALSNGLFVVPNMREHMPPARVTFRMDGPVPAAAELIALDRLRDFSGALFDPTSTKGIVSAQVTLGMPLRPDLPPGSTDYDITVDLSNFSADKMLFGQKVEAQTLRVAANNQSYEIKGDVRIAGAPAQIEYRKLKGETDAEVKVEATLDEAARARLGIDPGNALSGALPMRLAGRVSGDERESRFNVEADLTAIKIDNLLPGWVKPAGKQARIAFTLVKQKTGMRFDDFLIDGQGMLAKGAVELDSDGELQAANFPVFAISDGDKVTVRIDRGSDGALRVLVRGDVYDGRNFVKSAMSGPVDPKIRSRYPDLDIDIKIGVVAGHYGETIRGLEWRMSRRGGRVRTFSMNAKIGRDSPFLGEMRTRINNGKPVLYFETSDAGALFRFTDIYSRMIGGKIWIGMDPPAQDGSPQEGIVNVSAFSIRGENTLDRVVSNAPNAQVQNDNIDFNQARADFIRVPGRMTIKDGVLRGPMIGATVEGNIDYVRDQVSVRGTLVPLYGLNNMFGQIPIVGLFLGGGSNEGMFGITYEVSGTTSNPRAAVNPISAIAPGVLRKFFEFRDTSPGVERSFAEPQVR
jgi:uncharacterized protein DUF3971